jgi:hypothetical protein
MEYQSRKDEADGPVVLNIAQSRLLGADASGRAFHCGGACSFVGIESLRSKQTEDIAMC